LRKSPVLLINDIISLALSLKIAHIYIGGNANHPLKRRRKSSQI